MKYYFTIIIALPNINFVILMYYIFCTGEILIFNFNTEIFSFYFIQLIITYKRNVFIPFLRINDKDVVLCDNGEKNQSVTKLYRLNRNFGIKE